MLIGKALILLMIRLLAQVVVQLVVGETSSGEVSDCRFGGLWSLRHCLLEMLSRSGLRVDIGEMLCRVLVAKSSFLVLVGYRIRKLIRCKTIQLIAPGWHGHGLALDSALE